MFKKRKEVEEMVYKVMDLLDPTKQNSQFYKAKFAKMNDKQFLLTRLPIEVPDSSL